MAELTGFGYGYGTFLHGKVVDMLYFPIKYVVLPDWLGGGDFLFFSPIFNIADASISIGVFCILVFQRQFFREVLGHDTPAREAVLADELADTESFGEPSPSDVLPDEPILLEEAEDHQAAPASEIPSESGEDKSPTP